MAIGTLVLVASTWLAGTSASYASVNRVNIQLTVGTSPRPGHGELVHLSRGSIHPQEDECPVGHRLEYICKDQGSYTDNIYDCPSLNGNTRVTPNGDLHKIYCGVQTDRATLRQATTDSFIACVDTCSEDEECVGVGWNHCDSVCTMKTEYITPAWPSVENSSIDSSSEQCPYFDPEAEECPSVNGKIRCDFGEQFRLFCGLALNGPNLSYDSADNMYECVGRCAANTSCMGIDFVNRDKRCYLKSTYLDVPIVRKSWSYSAVFVGRRR